MPALDAKAPYLKAEGGYAGTRRPRGPRAREVRSRLVGLWSASVLAMKGEAHCVLPGRVPARLDVRPLARGTGPER